MLTSCGTDELATTRTSSGNFKTLSEKKKFLEKYVTFTRTYKKLEFNIIYQNNSSGLVPGPSDFNISIYANVPKNEINFWINGLTISSTPKELSWVNSIPNSNKIDLGSLKWYTKGAKFVAISNNQDVLYKNSSF